MSRSLKVRRHGKLCSSKNGTKIVPFVVGDFTFSEIVELFTKATFVARV